MAALVSTALAIVNISLTLLGQKKLAALDDTTEIGRKANALFPIARDSFLRDVKPNFAKTEHTFKHTIQGSEKSISGATKADPVVITSAAHGLSNGDTISIYDVGGMIELNGKRYIIANVTTNTFELQDENENDIDGTDFTTYTSGGKFGLVAADPLFDWSFRYTLPSDYVAMFEINGNEEDKIPYAVRKGELWTNEAELKGIYIAQVTDYTLYDADSIEVLAYKLAALLAQSITNLSTLAKNWEDKYEKDKAKAKGQKSQESGTSNGPPRQPIISKWLDSRARG